MSTELGALDPCADDHLSLITDAADRWDDAVLIAALLAIDPQGLRGAIIDAGPSPAKDHWLKLFKTLGTSRLVTVPNNADAGSLWGGLDLTASLTTNAPVMRRGLMVGADGGTVMIRRGESLCPSVVDAVVEALDTGYIRTEREGFSTSASARFAFLLFAEGGPDEPPPARLLERAAFRFGLDGIPLVCFTEEGDGEPTRRHIESAQSLLPSVTISDDIIGSLTSAALSIGAGSLRASSFCVCAARAIAAFEGRKSVSDEDAVLAARLVLGHRARSTPPTDTKSSDEQTAEPEDTNEGSDTPEMPQPDQADDADNEGAGDDPDPLEDMLVEAAVSQGVALQALGLLGQNMAGQRSATGKSGASMKTKSQGRPVGSEPGNPSAGGKLDLLATLRAAVPWQKLRPSPPGGASGLVRVFPQDLRLRTFQNKTASSVIFIVDASGSSAIHRLAEAKGAVETLLGECYARRDLVSVIAFRGTEAECILPPSRSLARARRSMASLAGGGGTPLASAIALGLETALRERAEGRAPLLVFFSDGQGNVGLDGQPGR
ncbi:MAG: VWA domain-containing protein, partial [Pseudomonadota bacterium]